MIQGISDEPLNIAGREPYNYAVNIVEAGEGRVCLIEADKLYHDSSLAVVGINTITLVFT